MERHQQQRQSRLSQGDFLADDAGGSSGSSGGGSVDGNRSGRTAAGPSRRALSSSSLMSAGLRRSYGEDGQEVTLAASDVRYAVASSTDPRCPPLSAFPGYTAAPLRASERTLRSSFDVRDSPIDENSDVICVAKSGTRG